MKLLIFNIPNTLNYGSMMMAENLLYYTNKKLPNTEFIITSHKPRETISRLSSALNGRVKIFCMKPQDVFFGGKIIKLIAYISGFGIKRIVAPELLNIDAVIVLGGDDYTEDYSKTGPIRALLRLGAFKTLRKKVYMCSQTIGPFSSWRKKVARHLLSSRINLISAREPITFNYLINSLKLTNVKLCADLAFLPLAKEKEDSKILSLCGDKYITIIPSEQMWEYAKLKSREDYIQFLTKISVEIIKFFNDYNIILLPHVLSPEHVDDRLTCRDLFLSLKREGIKKNRIIFIKEPILPFDARKILGSSKFVFTGRMHSAISSFSQGLPALSLSYSRKYWGIIGEYLRMKELIVDVRNYNSWEEIYTECVKRVYFIMRNYDSLKKKVKKKLPKMQNKAIQNINLLVKLITKSK